MWVIFYTTISIDATVNVVNPGPWSICFHANSERYSCRIYEWCHVRHIKSSWNPHDPDTACSTAHGRYHHLAKSTKAKVEKAAAGTDKSDLRASLRQALTFSIPPPTLYRNNNRSGPYSHLIFSVPLVDVETNQDNVPKVMRMCIGEVEKRGLNTKNIYSVSCSRRVSGFVISVADGPSTRRRHTTGQWNPSQMAHLPADMFLHSVTAEVRKWKVIFVLLLGQHSFYCDASTSPPLRPLGARVFLKFIFDPSPSSTSGKSQIHCLCCPRKITESTDNIEVLYTHTFHQKSSF